MAAVASHDAPIVVTPPGAPADELNDALERAGAGFVVTLDADTRLHGDALDRIRDAIRRFPDTDLLYGDTIDDSGAHVLPRPAFSPLRLREQDYLGGVKAFRASAARQAGGFRAQFAECAPYEAALRCAAAGARVLHVPATIGVSELAAELGIARRSDRKHPQPAAELRRSAVQAHLRDLDVAAEVELVEGGTCRVRYEVAGEPLVSLIIPTRGTSASISGFERVLVVDAVRGILERSTYRNLEFVVVADDETPQPVIDELVGIAGERLTLVRWSSAFNFSAKINRGAAVASGQYLLPLNDDVELISPDWIETFLGLAQQEGVGLVGAALYFEDGTVQHGGHLYVGGAAGHVAFGWQNNWDDRLWSMTADREVSGVTAACALVPADVFWDVGGFTGLLPGNYNDADFCLKVRHRGYRIVWSPHVKLYHFESKTRESSLAQYELDTIRSRWAAQMQLDPYWPEVRE